MKHTLLPFLIAAAVSSLVACRGQRAESPEPPAARGAGDGESAAQDGREAAAAGAADRSADDVPGEGAGEPHLVAIPNARVYEGALVGGQPTEEQLREAHAAGYTTVVNLRAVGEPMTDSEPALVEELGMTYVSIPISGPADFTRENAEALDRALDEAEGPVMVHCGSGNRVGSLYALRAFWPEGKPADQALAAGTRAGMTHSKATVQSIMDDQPGGGQAAE